MTLRASFRGRPNIQRAINAAFAPLMTGDSDVAAGGVRGARAVRDRRLEQPSVVVLPVPDRMRHNGLPRRRSTTSLPDAVGAFVDWLLAAERLDVTRGRPAATLAGRKPVPIQARHICVLFRRFISYGEDVTRPYVEALEARGVPHLLVGGRSFHNRAEVEALRAALAAIEWPDDELSVFAALRGPFFGIGDEELLEYRHQYGRFHPFRCSRQTPADAAAPADRRRAGAPAVAARTRNRAAVASTIAPLLEATRVHVRFALEHGGEQVLANVLRVADLARQYEADGGLSFRGFLEELASRPKTDRPKRRQFSRRAATASE